MHIGPYRIDPPVILAPMAGVTDKPFRQLCRRLGAGLAVSEMTTAEPRLWSTRKSRLRMDHADEPGPVSVQLAGTDPEVLAHAARHNVAQGAQIIDLNMGCPAKKVCNVAAGSALLRDELLVARILSAVVAAVPVPVTLKIRTGYSRAERNAVRIARVAEASGIAAIAVHGRTREDFFTGHAEYESVAAVKAAVRIPVIVNGDVDTPEKAAEVLRATGCDAIMLGRPALGQFGSALVIRTVSARAGLVRVVARRNGKAIGACGSRLPAGVAFTCHLALRRGTSPRGVTVSISLRVRNHLVAVRHGRYARPKGKASTNGVVSWVCVLTGTRTKS